MGQWELWTHFTLGSIFMALHMMVSPEISILRTTVSIQGMVEAT